MSTFGSLGKKGLILINSLDERIAKNRIWLGRVRKVKTRNLEHHKGAAPNSILTAQSVGHPPAIIYSALFVPPHLGPKVFDDLMDKGHSCVARGHPKDARLHSVLFQFWQQFIYKVFKRYRNWRKVSPMLFCR